MGDVVTDIRKFTAGWRGGLPETECGSGSRIKNTVDQREWIPQIFEKYEIRSVADVGAGDLNWISLIDLSGIDYLPLDLVPRHPKVKQFDIVNEVPPQVDMILCLWVLNHLPKEQCRRAIDNLKASGSTYLMMTDRPIWHKEQPKEIRMPYIEELVLNHKNDRIRVIEL